MGNILNYSCVDRVFSIFFLVFLIGSIGYFKIEAGFVLGKGVLVSFCFMNIVRFIDLEVVRI